MAMYILIPWRIYKLIVCHRLADSYFCIIQDNAASSRKNKDIAFPESTTYEFKNPVIPLLKFKVLHAFWTIKSKFWIDGNRYTNCKMKHVIHPWLATGQNEILMLRENQMKEGKICP